MNISLYSCSLHSYRYMFYWSIWTYIKPLSPTKKVILQERIIGEMEICLHTMSWLPSVEKTRITISSKIQQLLFLFKIYSLRKETRPNYKVFSWLDPLTLDGQSEPHWVWICTAVKHCSDYPPLHSKSKGWNNDLYKSLIVTICDWIKVLRFGF